MSYGELLVLSKSLLERVRQLDRQIRSQVFGKTSEVASGLKTQRAITYELLCEVGNIRQDHTEVDESKVIDI